MEALIRKYGAPEKWQKNWNTFIPGQTKRVKCRKVTEIYRKLEEDKNCFNSTCLDWILSALIPCQKCFFLLVQGEHVSTRVFLFPSEGKGKIRNALLYLLFFFLMPLAPSILLTAKWHLQDGDSISFNSSETGSQARAAPGPGKQGPFLKVWVSAKLGTLLQASES